MATKIKFLNSNRVEFCEIHCGDMFVYEGSLYLKTAPDLSKNCDYNATLIRDGKMYIFYGDEKISPVNVEINVEYVEKTIDKSIVL